MTELDDLPLRERKKLRTRQALIDTALTSFTERGYDAVTLDDLCAAVEVSKRTFFRTFTGKEDVAMAPLQDLWLAFLAELEHTAPRETGLLDLLQHALLAAVERIAVDEWPRRADLSYRLARATTAMAAHNLQFCDQVSRTAVDVLHRRFAFADPAEPHAHLAVDILVATFHRAMDRWIARERLDAAALLAELRHAFAAVPRTLTLTVRARGV